MANNRFLDVDGKVVSDEGGVAFQRVSATILVDCENDGQVKHWHGAMEIESSEQPQGIEGRIVTDDGLEFSISIPPLQNWEKYPAILFWGKGKLPAGL